MINPQGTLIGALASKIGFLAGGEKVWAKAANERLDDDLEGGAAYVGVQQAKNGIVEGPKVANEELGEYKDDQRDADDDDGGHDAAEGGLDERVGDFGGDDGGIVV